jgi:hypothetical protein
MISENDIIFFEGEKSLKWDKILKRIRDDPEAFVNKEGGWSAFADDEEALEAENEFENVNDSSFEEEELDVRQSVTEGRGGVGLERRRGVGRRRRECRGFRCCRRGRRRRRRRRRGFR